MSGQLAVLRRHGSSLLHRAFLGNASLHKCTSLTSNKGASLMASPISTAFPVAIAAEGPMTSSVFRTSRAFSTQPSSPSSTGTQTSLIIPSNMHVVVGMSGGVDSAVSALLLKQAGFKVTGVYMRNWDKADEEDQCSGEQDLFDVRRVCDHLQIPLEEANFMKEYWLYVFETFLSGYRRGLTPNPDLLCNRFVKFGAFQDYVHKHLNADYIATGHYARLLYPMCPTTQPPAISSSTSAATSSNSLSTGSAANRKGGLFSPSSSPSSFSSPSSPPHPTHVVKHLIVPAAALEGAAFYTRAITPEAMATTSSLQGYTFDALESARSFENTPYAEAYKHMSQSIGKPVPEPGSSRPFTSSLSSSSPSSTASSTATAAESPALGSIPPVRLVSSEDRHKDQTYFLSQVLAGRFNRWLFPVGHLNKTQVRQIAAEHQLPVASKRDSMGLCFVGKRDSFSAFIDGYIEPTARKPGPIIHVDDFARSLHIFDACPPVRKERIEGPFNARMPAKDPVDVYHEIRDLNIRSGRVPPRQLAVTEHTGLVHYTEGQRASVGGQDQALFILRKRSEDNTIFVCPKDHPLVQRHSILVRDFLWVADVPPSLPEPQYFRHDAPRIPLNRGMYNAQFSYDPVTKHSYSTMFEKVRAKSALALDIPFSVLDVIAKALFPTSDHVYQGPGASAVAKTIGPLQYNIPPAHQSTDAAYLPMPGMGWWAYAKLRSVCALEPVFVVPEYVPSAVADVYTSNPETKRPTVSQKKDGRTLRFLHELDVPPARTIYDELVNSEATAPSFPTSSSSTSRIPTLKNPSPANSPLTLCLRVYFPNGSSFVTPGQSLALYRPLPSPPPSPAVKPLAQATPAADPAPAPAAPKLKSRADLLHHLMSVADKKATVDAAAAATTIDNKPSAAAPPASPAPSGRPLQLNDIGLWECLGSGTTMI